MTGSRTVDRPMPMLALLLAYPMPAPSTDAPTLNLQRTDGQPVAPYRWLVEENGTLPVTPGLQPTRGVCGERSEDAPQ